MLEFYNVKVSDLRETIIACRNAMRTSMTEYTEEEFRASLPRAIALAKMGNGSGHTSWRKGIHVSFDMKYSQYISKQFQRYHWFDYVSSSSLMHRLTAMPVEKQCAKYVKARAVYLLQKEIDTYNFLKKEHVSEYTFLLRDGSKIHATTHEDVMYHQYMMCIQKCPMGYELFVRVSTNYEQLSTICRQRKNHKLREDYAAFFAMVASLPYAKELIICE